VSDSSLWLDGNLEFERFVGSFLVFAGTALEHSSSSDGGGAPSSSSGAGPISLSGVCVHILCVRVCVCVLAKEYNLRDLST
jgi:hypothetical protein